MLYGNNEKKFGSVKKSGTNQINQTRTGFNLLYHH